MKKRGVVLAIAALWSGQCVAQSATPISATDLSKEAENPVTRRITLPLRYEADFLDGPYKATRDTFEIDQAVVPFRLNEDWALITRTKLPAIVQPPKKLGDHWATGLSNGYTTFFLSPEHGEGFYWGAGPVLYYPSATPRRRTRRSASTNGAPARPRHSSRRMKARGSSAPSSTTSGPLAAHRAAATGPTSFC
jgi:hypothetical protein